MASRTPDLSFTLSSASPTTTRADAVVVAVTSDLRALAPAIEVGKAFGRRFATMLTMLGFAGEPGQVAVLPTQGAIRAGLVIAVGVGSGDPDPVGLRKAAARAITAAHNVTTVAYAVPTEDDGAIRALAEGAVLGAYRYDRYKTTAKAASEAEDHPSAVVILTRMARNPAASAALKAGQATASAVNRARDWVNTPPGDLTPEVFADEVSEATRAGFAEGAGVKATVWDEGRLAKEKCGGVLAVGQGSAHPPRLVTLTYRPRKAVGHLALVGKGITFDSGGLSLKPGASMMTMKCDMAGAASVAAATLAIAALGLPVRVTCVLPMAENMPSGSALRPGDVITIRGGKTVEVHNTDAEGRLVLADGLRVAQEADPDVLVDVATLTGAAVVALGEQTAGVLGNDEGLRSRIVSLGEGVGEAFWPLPITREVTKRVTSSEIADVRQHSPKPVAGTLYAAAFLKQFVDDDTTWAHLDIAGPAFNDGGSYDLMPKGGTGMSVRTLVALAESLASKD